MISIMGHLKDWKLHFSVWGVVSILLLSSLWQSLEVRGWWFSSACVSHVLRWLISPIRALKVLWHSGQVVPGGKLGLGCLCFSFRFLLFSSKSAHQLASKIDVPFRMVDRHWLLSIAVVSQLLVLMLHFFRFAFKTSLYLFICPPILRLPSLSSD